LKIQLLTNWAILVLLAVILLPESGTAALIQFRDFDWGLSLYGTELLAAETGFILEEKVTDPGNLFLTYQASIFEETCRIEFNFTPLSQKLYTVRLEWEGAYRGNFILKELLQRYHSPREEIPGANIHIWTRKFTELELRYDREITVLTYSNLNLWKDFKEEMERIEEEKDNDETE